MHSLREIEHPSILKAQRLNAERLGISVPRSPSSNAEEDREEWRKWPFAFSPVQKMQQTAILTQQDQERPAASSRVAPWLLDYYDSPQPKATREQFRCSSRTLVLQRQQQHQHHGSQGGDGGDRLRGRNPTPSGRCREYSMDNGQMLPPSRSRSRSKSLSPPPPAPSPLVREELSTSLERTRRDFIQISHSVCEEGAALERLLALEVAPAAQKLFDAAVAQHAKACRILDLDHIGGITSFNNKQQDERPARRSLPRDPLQNNTIENTPTSTAVDQNTSVASPDTMTSTLNTSNTSSEAWRRAVRAGVINVKSPSGLSPRPSLPARKLDLSANISACESPRWSIGGRFVPQGKQKCGEKDFVEAQEAVEEEENTAECARITCPSGQEGSDNNMAVRTRNGFLDDPAARENSRDFFDEDDEDDEDGILNFSRQVAADISSKIVGLSSRIRRRAAETSQGRRK